ncbi:hypothetical protein CYMTET_22554 [Cymbomonas tetramitiformis]|uniref:Uncharacterized protein n=1 Tax=Cymbomonas tetramitiformis TaxID=36881 RepID=A0AAE0FZZ5_9CHLO|nr:hypothetical protein CYMTET_22554 [Cymbomonas tetramitiformis]
MAFSNIPRKPRSGSVVPATVGKLESSGPWGSRLNSLLDAAAQEREENTTVSEVQAESEGHVQDTDANLPPEFEPSPPVSPGVAQAAAAAAAAVAAKAECTTWISGEPCSSMNHNNGSSSRSEGSVLSWSEEEQVDSTSAAKKRATARRHLPYGRSEKRYVTFTFAAVELDSVLIESLVIYNSYIGRTFDQFSPQTTRQHGRHSTNLSQATSVEFRRWVSNKACSKVETGQTCARMFSPLNFSDQYHRCKVDEEVVYDRALRHLAAQFGAQHPEVGKALLQMARFYYARQQHEKAERYLIRSWEVFKLCIDQSRNVDEVFVSFISLCEEFNVTAEGLKGVKQEMQQISPSCSSPRGTLEWNKTP